MPRPVEGGHRYIPGLDGLRALAVLVVIAYHLNLPWAPGGLLGVGVFFTLSGYLITELLLMSWNRTGGLDLANFWLRRARRLLPALFVMLAVVTVWVALLDAGQMSEFRRQVFAAAVYISNWWTIVQNGSYFARFAAPLPLDHLWSLAIEEQFYLVWPWLLWFGLVKLNRRTLPLATLGLAVVSALLMATMYHPGYDPTRVYEGTDTRAFSLLIGAALAMVWPSGQLQEKISSSARNLLDAIGVAGVVVILLMVGLTSAYSSFLYRGGMVLLAVATAAAVAVLVHPASRLGKAFGWEPMRWLGVRSYGLYLWHWPIILLTTPADGHISLLRGTLQVLTAVIVAALSWKYVEEPIRHGALGRLWKRARSRAGAMTLASRRPALAAGGAATAVALIVLSLSGLLPAASSGVLAAGANLISSRSALGIGDFGYPATARTIWGAPRPVYVNGPGGIPKGSVLAAAKTSCTNVAYIGDSTSEGEVSPDYIPNSKQRLVAQLRDVGVRGVNLQISGARSVVETYHGEPNAAMVARSLISHGFKGCWILALGTNDTADVYVGSSESRPFRVQRMMGIIGHQPVMWINQVSLVRSGPYSETQMRLWNQALMNACPRYPNMRVFDWAAHAKPNWFISDGIHYTSLGSVKRAQLISQGLAQAFPNDYTSGGCLVP